MDELLLLNFITDYMGLRAAAILAGEMIRRRRLALSALLGALYAAAAVLKGLSFLQQLPFQLLTAALMIVTAYGIRAHLVRLVLCYWGVSALFCGAVMAVGYLLGRRQTGAMLNVDLRLLMVSTVLCYVIIQAGFKRLVRDAKIQKVIDISICFRGRSRSLRGFYDTGNKLRDPLSGKRVIVVTAEALRELLPKELQECLDEDQLSRPQAVLESLALSRDAPRFGLVPYSSVGSRGGMLLTFRPDRILIDGNEEKGRLIAFSPGPLSPAGEFDAIVN